jgi:hypothetical protein
VRVEGWAILGAMLGVGPVEESCEPISTPSLNQDSPAEEMYVVEGTQEAADAVAKKKFEAALGRTFGTLAEAEAAYMDHKEAEKAAKKTAQETVFITWPEAHNGHRAFVKGKLALRRYGLEPWMLTHHGARWNDVVEGWYIPNGEVEALRETLRTAGCPFLETK